MPKNFQLRKSNQLYVDLPLADAPPDHRFYVLFHGLVTLVDGPGDELRAYALSMDYEHRYGVGHWLVEQDLPNGFRATLSGVSPAKKTKNNSLNPKLNPTIRLKGWLKDDDPRIHARITLPRPRRIHYLGLGDAAIARPDLLIYPTTSVSGLTVFEYKMPRAVEELALRIDNQAAYWTGSTFTEFPALKPAGAPTRVATLHILDAPSQMPAGDQHSLAEFGLSTSLLGQPEVQFLRKPVDLAQQPAAPQGISSFETIPIPGRAKLLHRLADFARTARFTGSEPLCDPLCKSCCSAGDGQWP